MMKRILSLPLLSFLFLTFAACERDDEVDTFDGIKIIAEPLSSGAKVAVDGTRGTWTAGEQIRINSSVETVEYHDGSAYIPYDSPQEVNRALYPASLTASSLSSDLVNVTFPAEYHYQTSGVHQILELPMAARSSGRNPLHFHHLTGALCFLVINDEASTPLTLQSITVVSSGYRLNGTRRINIASPDTTSALTASLAADRTVKMYFDHGLVVPAGDTARVMIPVAPVGADNRFTVTVKYFQDGTNNSFKFTRTQSTGGALLRNQLGYAPTNIQTTESDIIEKTAFFEKENTFFLLRSPLDFRILNQACNNNWVYPSGSKMYYYYGGNYKIKDDLDMSGYTFEPMNTLFSGTIDGEGHTISNLTIESCPSPSDSRSYVCAFLKKEVGAPTNITFDNLTLRHQSNITGNLTIGGLVATATSSFSHSNCTVNIGAIEITGSVGGTIYLGGIVGEASNAVSFTNCHVTTPAFTHSVGTIYWGGFVGYAAGNYATSISSSTWTGSGAINVTSSRNIFAGGMIGYKRSNTFNVSNSSVEGTINVSLPNDKYYYLGSLVGYFYTPGSPTITSTTRNVTFTLNGFDVSDIPDYNYTNYGS